ncbi:MAG: hypothetical protein AAB345_00905 [Patescibacteria group bacterium]
MLKLFLFECKEESRAGYDYSDMFLVVASNVAEAVEHLRSGGNDESHFSVRCVGTAEEGVQPGILMESYIGG